MEKREEVIQCLRSCLISTKGKCDLTQLKADYRMVMGGEIPHRQFGYPNCEDFIKSIPSLTVSRGSGGEFLVDARPDEKSSHISALVSRQKEKKKKIKINQKYSRSNNGYYRPSAKWRPTTYGSKKPAYKSSSLPQQMSHNQFINKIPQMKSSLPTYKNDFFGKRSPPKDIMLNQTHRNNQQQNYYQQNYQHQNYQQQQNQQSNSKKVDLAARLHKIAISKNEPEQNNVPKATVLKPILNNDIKPKTEQFERYNFNGPTQSRSKFITQGSVHFESDNSSTSSELFENDRKPILRRHNSSPSQSYDSGISSMTSSIASNSANSSNDTFKSADVFTFNGAKEETFFQTGDCLVDLYAFTQLKRLDEPEFKVIARKTRPHKNPLYDCKLKIGQYSYSSYPSDFGDEVSAKQYAAKLALDELIPKFDKSQKLLVSTFEDILLRIPPIVEKHYHGVWSWQLEADYVDTFHEQLPINWIEVIDSSPFISVEHCMANKFVLRYCKNGEHFQKGTNPNLPLAFDVSIPSNTIQFNENGTLQAEITCVVSAKEIWCRQLDTPESEAFIEMSLFLDNGLSSPYRANSDSLRAKEITVGGYYIAQYDNLFIRVRILEVLEHAVNCFQVDFGDECTIPKHDVYEMKREVARSQAQAFICRLAGLEELYEFSTQSETLQQLIGKQVVIERGSEETVEIDSNDPVIAVVMYDPETKSCLNKEIISTLTLESASPSLTAGINEVLVKQVEDNGDIYVQIPSPGLEKLENLMYDMQISLAENFPNIGPLTYENLHMGKLYLAKYESDNLWYRIQIIDFSPCKNYAQIYFVDFGNTQIITVKDEILVPLDEVSDLLSQFPPQAVRVRVSIDSIPPNFVESFKKLLHDDDPLLLKILGRDNKENIPFVEVYKRSERDRILYSINKAIALENEFIKYSSAGDGNNNQTLKPSPKIQRLMSLNQFEEMKNVPSSGSLKTPDFGKIGEYFDVKIPHAVSPWNFFVQPYGQNELLNNMQKKLQEKCLHPQVSPFNIEDIQPGRIYACKHTDGNWYRTSVLKVIGPGSISVCYCDFGYYSNVSVDQLLPLDSEFMVLPYQAIKAKLAGIKPIRDKWSLEDCTFFQNLVVRKTFVSVVVKTEKDELYRLDTVLLLNLFDTSEMGVDVNVGHYLIEQKKAVGIK